MEDRIATARSNGLGYGPVWWARLGPVSQLIAACLPAGGRPVLVVSLPRSGSSWIGETLGQATNAAYLREPVNQAYLRGHPGRTVFEAEPGRVDAPYRRFSERAFRGIPDFPPHVVPQPVQWRLRDRRHRTVVLKEVNPLALPYWCSAFAPTVVALVRHPAGVATSLRAAGWGKGPMRRWFSNKRYAGFTDAVRGCERSFWHEIGASQAVVHQLLIAHERGSHSVRLVRYEQVCAAPAKIFRALFDFAGLRWHVGMDTFIQRRTETKAASVTEYYGTERDSSTMAEAWRERISAADLAALKDGYFAAGGTCYGGADW